MPTVEGIAAVRSAGKRTIIAGPTVAEKQIDNWSQVIAASVDAVLTDYPLEFRRHAAAIDD